MRTLVATSLFLFLEICVTTSIRCRDLTLYAFTVFLCRDLDSMSRHHFCCQPLYFLVTTSLFMLRHHSVVLSLQADRDSNLLVCLFSCRDMDIRSYQVVSVITVILVTTSKVCHDHYFFLSNRNLISQSQQFSFNFLFLVTT